MLIPISNLDQNLILKNSFVSQDHQNFNSSSSFLSNFIFFTLILSTVLLRQSLTNPNPLGILANQRPPIKRPEPKIIYDHYRENICVF